MSAPAPAPSPFLEALRARPVFTPPERRAVDVLLDGGLSLEAAIGLVTNGATAAEATDLLSPALLSPSAERYGASLVALRVLQTAREAGGVTAPQVRRIVATHARMVVVRPDGYLAPALGGSAIQRSGQGVRVEDGRLMAGTLPVGETFFFASGTLYAVEAGDARGRPIAHLGLEHDVFNQVLDGVELAVGDMLREAAETIVRLVEDPVGLAEDAVVAFGEIPNAIATLIRKSPELYASFTAMSSADQVRAVSRAVSTLALAFVGAGLAAGGARAAGGGARLLRIAEVGGAVVDLDGAAVALGLAALGVGGGMTGIALASGANDVATPRERWTLDYRVQRGVGDVMDRGLYEGPSDLRQALTIAEGMGPREAAIVRRRVAERVVEDLADADYRTLAELAKLRGPLGAEANAVDAALKQRLRREVAAIRDMPADNRRVRRASALRAALDDADIDLARVLRQGGTPPALMGDAAKAFADMKRGREVVYVKTRAEAEAIVAQFPELVDTGGWGFKQIKNLLRQNKDDTVHWDVEFGPNDKIVMHNPKCDHADIAHVQFNSTVGEVTGNFRIEFGERRRGKND
ncbi:MAG: hypothetical protein RIT81_45015 [Deltaproteobacteria bacterium]